MDDPDFIARSNMENSVPPKMVQELIYLIIFKESNKRLISITAISQVLLIVLLRTCNR